MVSESQTPRWEQRLWRPLTSYRLFLPQFAYL